MKKINIVFGIVGLFALMTVSFVAGAVLTSQDYFAKYPDDPLIRTFQACDGDLPCVKSRVQEMTCIEIDETTHLGRRVIRFACTE